MVILADVRENPSGIPGILANEYGISGYALYSSCSSGHNLLPRRGTRAKCICGYGIKVVPASLKTGDYIIDKEIVIERKTALDFAQSIIDGRLFKQAAMMKRLFEHPLIIVEGDMGTLPDMINIHPRAVKGTLISLALAWQITVLFSKDKHETALLLCLIATQETKSVAELSSRPGRRPKRLHKRQLYILQGLPGVGPKAAIRLLDRFRSVEAAMTASEQDMMGVRGLGKKKTGRIREILTAVCGECGHSI